MDPTETTAQKNPEPDETAAEVPGESETTENPNTEDENEARSDTAESEADIGTLKGRIEAVLFVAGEPVLLTELARALQCGMRSLKKAIHELQDEYDFQQRGFDLRFFGSHVQLTTRAIYSDDVVNLLQPVQKQSLSQAAMETLAVVAYRQPVTKADVEQVRGVRCDYSIQSLVNKGLISEIGRKDALGRPILYGTTDTFLQHFGLSSLADLPPMPMETEEKKQKQHKEEEREDESEAAPYEDFGEEPSEKRTFTA